MECPKKIFESNMPKIEAAIGNSFTDSPSSWRSEKSITSWLKEYDIPYSGGFDVRNITKYLRDKRFEHVCTWRRYSILKI